LPITDALNKGLGAAFRLRGAVLRFYSDQRTFQTPIDQAVDPALNPTLHTEPEGRKE